jgi:hypothetical protein
MLMHNPAAFAQIEEETQRTGRISAAKCSFFYLSFLTKFALLLKNG